jgi:hypothetical protein
MAIFNARNVTSEETCSVFDIALTEPLPFSVTNETRVFGRLKFISPDFMLVFCTLEPLTTD